jgi:hypothetical protein
MIPSDECSFSQYSSASDGLYSFYKADDIVWGREIRECVPANRGAAIVGTDLNRKF